MGKMKDIAIQMAMDKEELTDDEVFVFLDNLRESGEMNMLAAAPSVQREFAISRSEAQKLLMKWMKQA